MSEVQSNPVAPLGQPLARRVWRAVNAAERLICGEGAVPSAAVAEGMALAGRRAARTFDPVLDEAPLAATRPARWVDHRFRAGPDGPAGPYAFELCAADGQEAVDQCVVAHHLTVILGWPGLCSLDRHLAESTELVRLPSRSVVDELPQGERDPQGDGPDVFTAARTAFAAVSRQTGRIMEPVARHGPPDARYLLVASGYRGRIAERAAEILRARGVSCAVLVPALLRPFPSELLRAAASGAEKIAVLSGAPMARRAAAILRPSGSTVQVTTVAARDAQALVGKLERTWSLDPSEGGRNESEPNPGGVAMAGWPGGPWTEELLLDTAGRLGWLGAPAVDGHTGGAEEPSIVTVGERYRELRPVDLLLVTEVEALDGVASLERIREQGTLLLRASTEDPRAAWSRLDDAQRATIVRRRLELKLVPPDAEHRTMLQGALLAATPGLGRLVGRDGDLVAALTDAIPIEVAGDLAALMDGARACVVADPARLGEPLPAASEAVAGPPRMPGEDAPANDGKLAAELRHFHFTGQHPEGARMPPWASLRPAVLDAPEVRESIASAMAPAASPFKHWSLAVLEDRRRRRAVYLVEIDGLATRLRHTLGLPSGPDAGELAAKLGEVGAAFVNPSELLELSRKGAAPGVDAERAERMTGTLQALERSRKRLAGRPVGYVLCPAARAGLLVDSDVEVVPHVDALGAAVGLFDGLAVEAVELARAVRAARLEIGRKYDPAVHDAKLARLDRQSLTAEELCCIPALLVLEQARHLRGPALASLSTLIRAGRPVHVLVEEPVGAPLAADRETGYHPGLGYLAVAHREALVVQSSIARPAHLAAGLARAVAAVDPVVLIVAAPAVDVTGGDPLEAAVQGRATPCFVYDPAGGVTWAERFNLEGNPQPERSWPAYTVECADARGKPGRLEQFFTFAHAAALDPVWRTHFLVVRSDVRVEGLMEIGDYFGLGDRERSKALPFVWCVRQKELVRAVITWELAFACSDRARAWRILQELAGTDNAYARRAAEEARRVSMQEAEVEIEKLRTESVAAVDSARGEGAAAAVGRLVRLLADPRGLKAAMAASSAAAVEAPPAPSSAVAVAEQAAEAPEAEEERAAPGLPYIDSFLCTTCNDCIDVNPRLFRYNADKQAEIADPAAGTFKELVKAAEACPARCIHPGAPREGDATATPALIKRARKFD